MNTKQIAIDAVYSSDIGQDAIYETASGNQIAIRAREATDPSIGLEGTGVGIRTVEQRIRVRVSEIADPCKSDRILFGGEIYTIQDREKLNRFEWVLYVVA